MSFSFSKVYIEISNICNLQCSFCPEVIREKKIMSSVLFEEILKQVTPLTKQVCLHLMGEPLAHPEFLKIINICKQYNTKIFLVTNGILLRDDKAQILLDSCFEQVNFSLHSFADNFPNKNPDQYLEKIINFTEQAFKIRPDLYINYRLWNLNDVHGSTTDNNLMMNKICDHFGIKPITQVDVRKKKSILINNRLYFHFDTEFIWPSLDLPILGTKGRCYGLSSHFGIHADGTVVPCCLDKEAGISLGNVNQASVLEILNRNRAKNILKGFKENRLIEDLCQRCQYIERFK